MSVSNVHFSSVTDQHNTPQCLVKKIRGDLKGEIDMVPKWEHRIHPLDKTRVEVRRKPRRAQAGRRHNWNLYMQCDTPQQAAHVLMLLRHGEVDGVVSP